jgi:hypothetical protein|tara:strand:- start:4100 stop:5932 length:1833 start_codon:yes stop_codon:yes gene_type:complete
MKFNKITTIIAVILSAIHAHGQVKELSLPLQERLTLPHNVTESLDTLIPPFVDDFSYPSDIPNPALWMDRYVWINDELPLFQNSIGVATFDGLNEFGFAYKENSIGSDTFADVLTSNYLNLQGLTDVYLSFQYQSAGRGEAPSINDSLVVEFWSPITNTWLQQWGTVGASMSTAFRSAIIAVQGSDYLANGFKFRIAAYGARAGAYDIWNIDYVQLDKDRTNTDTIITEPTFARNHPLIIGSGGFTSWPWWVSSTSNIANIPTTLTYTYRRNGTVPSGGWSLNLGQFRWEENGILIQQTTAVPVITNTQHNQDQTFDIAVPASALTTMTGPTSVTAKVWFDGSAAGYRSNDTVRGALELDNYLALDDGTADRAYAVQNITGGRVAQLFRSSGLGPADSLKGVRFQFVDAGTRYQSTFRIAVWAPADSGDAPGDIIYMSDSLYDPHWGYNRGDWIPYELDSSVDISIYPYVWIGYVCTSSDPLYLGFDTERILPQSMPRYYGDGFNWYPSLEPGVTMFQPFFRYSPAVMLTNEDKSTFVKIFPNPSQDGFSLDLDSEELFDCVLMDNQGKNIASFPAKSQEFYSFNYLPAGLYTVVLSTRTSVSRFKWMKL